MLGHIKLCFNCLVLFLIIENNILCENIDVNTSYGIIRGTSVSVLNQNINQFLGIPYAVPPTGKLRFAKPKPIKKSIEGIIDCTKPKNSCLQSGHFSSQTVSLKTSEDCLVLNIWSQQSSNSLKPVMFWLHGGALKSGSIFQDLFNGSVLATYDVVLVSANYRLGNFGFLYGGEDSAPGNVGLYDQILALKWVRENIHLFGGDKNQITVFGESAGGRSIAALIISPKSKGLFRRAIMQSGSVLHYKERETRTKKELLLISKQLAKSLNCTDDKQWLECLRTVDAKDVNKVQSSLTFPLEGTEFLPYSVQKAFSQSKYMQDIDILSGVTRNEGSLLAYFSFPRLREKEPELNFHDFEVLVQEMNDIYHGLNLEDIKKYFLKNKNSSNSNDLRQAIYELFGDLHCKCPTYLFAKEFAEHTPKGKSYFYELTFQAKNMAKMGCDRKTMGICHGADIELIFGLPFIHQGLYTEQERQFSKSMVEAWTYFAKIGKPDSKWTTIDGIGGIVEINLLNPMFNGLHMIDPYRDSCEEFWQNYFK